MIYFCVLIVELPTGFQASPVNLFEEGLILELSTVIILEPEAFRWVLFHQPFANSLTVVAKDGSVGHWIIQDSSSHLIVLHLKEDDIMSGAGWKPTGDGRTFVPITTTSSSTWDVPFLLAL